MDDFPYLTELPLTEATFLILLTMIDGPQHGYAIIKNVEKVSNGRVIFSTGTLYGALKRLLEQGWIERFDSDVSENNGRARKEYQLTELGHRIVLAETNRLETLVTISRLRLKGSTL